MESEERDQQIKEQVEYYKSRIRRDLTNLLKWLVLGAAVGCAVGAVSSFFARVLGLVTSYRVSHPWVFLCLPIAGICIVFLYQKIGKEDGGTTQVLSTIRSKDDVPWRSAPLIFVSTVLTHLTGGSAGREGAAIQLGGSMGNQLGRWLRMDEEDRHVMVMCGMSAAFAAVFGTPMAAAVFAMEVISVGVMYYAALLPCVTAALIASEFAASFGIHPEVFHVADIPALSIESGLKMMAVSLVCGAASILFCIMLRGAGRLYRRWLKNPYVRVAAAGIVIIALTALLQTTDYMGAGNELIARAVEEGKAEPFNFFWKMVLTALTMKAGFRGGEIVPSFCIGATLGCVLGQLLGISPSICAAAGMTALFCGVTNCPITSILIAFELFGFEGVSYYLIAVAISYAVSGYYGLYKDQTIVYSKYKAKYVNHHTRS
ncbi:MAG: chloride channel protein [Eubacteriales bacterium]|nr:chloride channel protein [Eubacteriales bacterium]